jgi:predicted nucleic acid-binding protein
MTPAGGSVSSAEVVSNTTPVSNLIRIQQLPLLGRVFGRVAVPVQVAEELDRGKHVLGPWRDAPGAEHLVVEAPLDGPFLRQLLLLLDAGEAGAIALAVERGAFLLMDERAGRNVAAAHRLGFLGTLGILVEAKRHGYLAEVRPSIDALEREGFWVGAALRARVLRETGEAE